jgi:hypothetical protein
MTNARNWNQGWIQVVSIDPARKNYALRIERRYYNTEDNKIVPVVFDKVALEESNIEDNVTTCVMYDSLSKFLDKYKAYYNDCHFIIIERQLPQNYKATRIAQHTISYFSIKLSDAPLLPSIVEIDPKIKGKILGAPKNITDKQLKTWAVEFAHKLLNQRNDDFSLGVLQFYSKKQDDLSDTVCQIEALFILWGLSSLQPDEIESDLLITSNSEIDLKSHKNKTIATLVKTAPTRQASGNNITSPINLSANTNNLSNQQVVPPKTYQMTIKKSQLPVKTPQVPVPTSQLPVKTSQMQIKSQVTQSKITNTTPLVSETCLTAKVPPITNPHLFRQQKKPPVRKSNSNVSR